MNPESGSPAPGAPIHVSVAVRADVERAFDVFTSGMGSWWPMDAYSRTVNEFSDEGLGVASLEFQPRLGGAILEHLSDGRVLPWGEVTGWDPPRRVVMTWRPHSLPEPPTEIEVTFAGGADDTIVQVEHRGWDQVSAGFLAQMYGLYVSGWPSTLDLFVAAAQGSG